MIRIDIPKSILYQELDSTDQLKFDTKQQKFISNVDNVYFTCQIDLDSRNNNICDLMIEELSSIKEIVLENKTPMRVFSDDDLYLTTKRFNLYSFCISKPDMYDIFIASSLPNDDTPRILIQVRSLPLWTVGYRKIITEAITKLNVILLHRYNLKIDYRSVKETRIDYAFHTNYIQNHSKFFSDTRMAEELHYTGIYSKVGKFTRNQEKAESTIDYLSLGSRNSNNVFVRHYNKTREVIELGYKSYFLDIWKDEKMISDFDYWCIKKAYEKKSYGYLSYARALYYIEFGKDMDIKLDLHRSIENQIPYAQMDKKLKNIVPRVTLITNIEFETKRKFYRTCDDWINRFILLPRHSKDKQFRIITILDNQDFFTDYLTSEFMFWGYKNYYYEDGKKISENVYSHWWKKLRNTKHYNELKLKRNYDSGINEERLFTQFLGKVASFASLNESDSNDLTTDLLDLMNHINDNHKSDYISIKEKKDIYYKNKLPKSPK